MTVSPTARPKSFTAIWPPFGLRGQDALQVGKGLMCPELEPNHCYRIRSVAMSHPDLARVPREWAAV